MSPTGQPEATRGHAWLPASDATQTRMWMSDWTRAAALVWSDYVRRCCECGRIGSDVCGVTETHASVHPRPSASFPPRSVYLLPPRLLFRCEFFLFYLLQSAVSFSFTYPDLHACSIAVSSFSLPILPFSHSSVPSGVSSSLPRRCFSW